MSQVRSVEPESTTTISSAQRMLSSVRGRLDSSFSVTMAMERVSGIQERMQVFSHARRDECPADRATWGQPARLSSERELGLVAADAKLKNGEQARQDSRGRLSPHLARIVYCCGAPCTSARGATNGTFGIWVTSPFSASDITMPE